MILLVLVISLGEMRPVTGMLGWGAPSCSGVIGRASRAPGSLLVYYLENCK